MKSNGAQGAHLVQFARAFVPLALIFGGVDLFGAWALGDGTLAVAGVLTALLAPLGLWARSLAEHGELATSAKVSAYGLLTMAVWGPTLIPFVSVSLVLVPVLAVAVALPYLRGRALRRLLGAALVASGLGVLGGRLFDGPPSLPPWFATGLVLSSAVAATALIVLLLAQFRHRLRNALAASLEANHALQVEEARFRSLIQATAQIIWMTDAQGRLRDSPSWRGFTGQSQEDLQQARWGEAIHPDDRAKAGAAWERAVATGMPYVVEYRLRRVDGVFVPMLARGVPVLDERGVVREWVGTNTDMSEVRAVEAELRRAIQSRDDFLSQATHELKTPLTSVRLQVQNVLVSLEQLSADERMSTRLAILERQVLRLDQLITQLLDISRISSGRINLALERVELSSLVRAIAERELGEPSEKGLSAQLELPDDLWGSWDRSRVDQVLTNLLGNGVKYGDGKPLKVSLRRQADCAVLEVKDLGIGVAPEDHQRIFERFERVATGRGDGFGLGLWIVRQIVEAHGGRIRVASALGEGTTFTVELPGVTLDPAIAK